MKEFKKLLNIQSVTEFKERLNEWKNYVFNKENSEAIPEGKETIQEIFKKSKIDIIGSITFLEPGWGEYYIDKKGRYFFERDPNLILVASIKDHLKSLFLRDNRKSAIFTFDTEKGGDIAVTLELRIDEETGEFKPFILYQKDRHIGYRLVKRGHLILLDLYTLPTAILRDPEYTAEPLIKSEKQRGKSE